MLSADNPITLELSLEDRVIPLDRRFNEAEIEEPQPQVVLLASGETTPFRVEFYREINGGRYLLYSGLDGATEVSELGFDGN